MSRKRRIIFTDNKQSDRGIMSLILGVICVLSLLYSMIASLRLEGELSIRYGAALFMTLVFGIAGLALGIVARRDGTKFKLIPTVGIIVNGLVVFFLAVLLWIGLR